MVISPILLLMMDPQSVVTAINSLSVLVLAVVLFQARRDVPDLSNVRALPLALAGLAGVPVGVLILSSASPGVLRVTIAAIIIALALPSAFNVQRRLPWSVGLSPLFGFLGSMLVTGMGVGVPLVALFLVNQGWPGRTVRTTISLYYMVVAAGAITIYAAVGLYTMQRVWTVLALTPAVILGAVCAALLVKRVSDRALRNGVLVVAIGASLALLGREVAP